MPRLPRPSFASVASMLALFVALGGGSFAVAQDDPVVEVSVPAGTVAAYAGSTPPSGYLLADGSEVNRLQYPALFQAIGTTYGAGNGTTTFNLPDLRGRVVVGRGTHADVDALTDNDGLAASGRKVRHRHSKGTIAISESGHRVLWNEEGIGQFAGLAGGSFYGPRFGSVGHPHPNSAVTGEVGDTAGPLNAPAHQVLNYVVKH